MILDGKYHLQGEVSAPSGYLSDLTGSFGGRVNGQDPEEMANIILSHTQAWWFERNTDDEQTKEWYEAVLAADILYGIDHDAPPGPTFLEFGGGTIEVGNQVDNDYGTDDPFPYEIVEVTAEQVVIKCEQGEVAIPKTDLSDFYNNFEDRQAALEERLPRFRQEFSKRYKELEGSTARNARYQLEYAILEADFDGLATDYYADQDWELLDYDIQNLFAGILYFADPETIEQEVDDMAAELKAKIIKLNGLYDAIGFPEKISIVDHGH